MLAVLFGLQIRREDRVDRIEVIIRRESRPLKPAKCLPPSDKIVIDEVPPTCRFAS